MNASIQCPKPKGIVKPHEHLSSKVRQITLSRRPFARGFILLFAVLMAWVTSLTPARAHESPPGCTGSALGVNLFTDSKNVHIGERIDYSVTVFNGLPADPRVACDATEIIAGVVTPDGLTNMLTLNRTTLLHGQADFYQNVVSYIVRAQDILPDGTVRATAFDNGNIHQNDTDSRGGAFQGLNSEVVQPCILVTAVCVGGVGQNGSITFTGTVRNCGNAPLNNVTVSNTVNGATVRVFGPTTLAVGQSAPFNSSWVPANPCAPSTATLTATGTDDLTVSRTVTSRADITCENTLTPSIKVTKICPPTPVVPGQPVVYSGTVTNTGNVTLTNVVVIGDQPAPNTTVFTIARLAPGAGASFTGSYPAPVDCSTTSSVTARGTSICGVLVTDSASSTCPLATNPQIVITAACPTAPLIPGAPVNYTGTVRNTGNVPLNNITVIADRPAANTTIFTLATLAPGASANFTGSYTAPANICSVTVNLTGSGQGICSDGRVSNATSITCSIQSAPAIAVTLSCPATPGAPGGEVSINGTVRNTGDVTLKNVIVASPNLTVLNLETLAPGASANFTAIFVTPADACAVTGSVTASGRADCGDTPVSNTASVTCPLATNPGIDITQECPTTPVTPGGTVVYQGTVRNTGNITLTNIVVSRGTLPGQPGPTPVGLVGFWALNEEGGTLAQDGSGLGNNGTLVSATRVAGKVGNAVSFNGTTSAVTIPNNSSLNFSGAITISAWVKPNSATGKQNIVAHGYTTSPDVSSSVFLRINAGRYEVGSWDGVSEPIASVAMGGGDIGSFVHLTGVYNGLGWVLYRDGVAVATTLSGMGSRLVNADWAIGARANGPDRHFNGVIDEVRIYNRGLSAAEVAGLTSTATPPVPAETVFTAASLAPGATVNFNASLPVPADGSCTITSTLTVSGNNRCTGVPVTDNVTTTCPLVTAPGIDVTLACPAGAVTPGANVVYTGTVKNTGNVPLTGVTVVSDQPTPNTTVFTVASLAPGVSANFTTTLTVPADACAVTANVVARAQNQCAETTVTDNATATCPVTTAPAIAVTLACPATPVATGAPITFTGTVRNTGNVTLKNVSVVSPQPAPNNVVLTVPTLAPGASANFNLTFTTPANSCAVSASVVATGSDNCTSSPVSNNASVTCPLTTAPAIVVTILCPPTAIAPGSAVNYSGTVRNTGNITLTNVVVLNNRTGTTPVFTAPTLAPGATLSFNGSFPLPADSECAVTSTLTATGADTCTKVPVTDTDTATCPIITSPGIEVTQICPPTATAQGATLTYTGTVKNTGNVTLTNVVVVNNRPAANTVVFTAATLAPGATANFTGSYIVPTNCCVVSSTVLASGRDRCTGVLVTDASTKTCPVLTAPGIAVTKTCPEGPLEPGDEVTFTGTVKNTGNISLVNVTVVNSQPTAGTPVLGPITLAPGETVSFSGTYTLQPDSCGQDTLTARGVDICTELPVQNTATAICPITTKPKIAVIKHCPPEPTPFGGLHTYTGTVSNTGNVTLINVFVVDSQPTNNTPVLGPITLAPGASMNFSGSYTAPLDCCETTDTITARGEDRCNATVVTATSSQVCPLLTTPRIAVTRVCPPTTVPVGGQFTFSGTVSNTGDVNLTNVVVVSSHNNTTVLGPIELAPGESATYSGSYVVVAGTNPNSETVTATGKDTCRARSVTATANCGGSIPEQEGPFISGVTTSPGMATVTWTSTAGTKYRLQCKAHAEDPIWTDIPGDVTATGASASKDDHVGPTIQRFYRVMVLSE